MIVEIKDRTKAEGLAEGENRGRAGSVLTVLEARGFTVPEEVRRRILATTESQTLERWLRRAATASSVDEVLDEA